MLQILRGKVCNIADLPGGGGEVCKGESLQYNTGEQPTVRNVRLLLPEFLVQCNIARVI